MDDYIARLNIAHFRRLLKTELDDARRKVILQLLEEEERRLAQRQYGQDGQKPAPDS